MTKVDVVDLYELLEDGEGLTFEFKDLGVEFRCDRDDRVVSEVVTYEVLARANFNIARTVVERLFLRLRAIEE